MYSISYSAISLRSVNIAVRLTLGKPPRNNLHAASNKSGLSRLRLKQCRLRRSQFLQTILRGGLSSRQQSGSHCRCPAALLPWPPENENTLENGAAFKVNLRVVGFRRLLLPFESSPLPSPPARKALVESVNSNQSAYTEIGQTVTRTHKLPT